MLSIGDIVTLAGRPSDVFFTYTGRDQERERVPQEWAVFLICDADRWNNQLTTLASATVICSPLCRWLGCDCEVSSVTPDHVYVERESYVSPVPLAQITASNINLFLSKEIRHGQEAGSQAQSAFHATAPKAFNRAGEIRAHRRDDDDVP
jgi:hypothetical protein